MATAPTLASHTPQARRRTTGPGSHEEPAGSADLFRRMARSTGSYREALRQELVLSWMPMSRRLARRYRTQGEPVEDLEQVAALGLIKAIDGFDPELGHAFASYAVPTIDGELKRHFRDYTWAVHVPRSVKQNRAKVRSAVKQMETSVSNGTPPTSELAARTGLPEEDVRIALGAMDSYTPLSLDGPAGNGSQLTVAETTGAVDPALDMVIDRESTRPHLRTLSEREATVLFLRYFEDKKQREIASALGISQMQVSRVLRATCGRIRDAVLDAPSA